jgi:hypothetical protein
MSNVSLVVMEKGSDWPGHIAAIEDVVAFSHDDLGLLSRTKEKLAALRSTHRSVRLAVLACNDDSGGATRDRRANVARELLRAVSETGFGRLVLTASALASSSLRGELMSLAGELTHGMSQTSPVISLQFTTAPDRRAPAREPRGSRLLAATGTR